MACLMDSFPVRSQGDRVSFDILLPADTGSVTGIHFVTVLDTANTLALQTRNWSHSEAGLVSLRWAGKGDIFLQAGVPLPKPNFEENFSPLGISPPGGALGQSREFAIQSSRLPHLELDVPGHLRQLKGFYKDLLLSLTGTAEAYRVHYFLHYSPKP